jgi:outer membrane protein TolC
MSGQQSGNAQSPAAAVSAGMGGGMSMGSIPSATASPEAMSQAASMEEASSSGMSEVLRIRLEMAETDSNMESLLSEIQAEKARFNALLNRPADSAVTLPDSLLQTPYSLDMETAMQLVSAQNPMLGMIGEERLAYRAKEEMARKMGYPMFGVGLQYMLIGKTPQSDSMSGMNDMNGKDMLMPMLSVTIPVYRRKYRAAQNESRLLRLSSEEKYADTFNRLQAELHQYRHQLDDASRKITLYRKQTEIARAAYAMMVQAFAAGKSGLDEVIRIQRQILDYELKISEAVAAYNTLTAQIYKMMSRQDSNNP